MLGEFTLLNKKEIDEQDKILKYFYLIDSDQIVEELNDLFKLEKIDINDNSKIDHIFHILFETIYKYSSLYNQYINPENFTYSAFFNEPGFPPTKPNSNPELSVKYALHMKKLECFQIFLKLFLRNHCITQGFFYNLFQSDSSHEPLTSTYDSFLKLGYFDRSDYKKEDYTYNDNENDVENNTEIKSNQFYYSKFKAFKGLGKNSLLERLLNDCHCEIIKQPDYKSGKKTLATEIRVPIIYKHWVYFIFCESHYITNLSRNLTKKEQDKKANILSAEKQCNGTSKKSNPLPNNYKCLFYEFVENKNKFTLNCDKFIFNTLGEYYFGFSTIYYINILLKEIHNPDSKYDYLKRYDSKILEDILKRVCKINCVNHHRLFDTPAFCIMHNGFDNTVISW